MGVDQGTLHWGYRDPHNGTIRGLDVDILRQIALAIFGSDPDDVHLQFKTLTTAERVQAVKSGKVDMVASLLTATCDRWNDVDFSTVYYEANQDVLVPVGSPVHTVDAPAGKTVCATRGSTSITKIQHQVPTAKIYPVDTRADCLVALQDGEVDAITSDDTILKSFQAQEEEKDTRLLGQSLESEPYAIAMPKGHEDLVRFVNGVLDHMRADGSLEALYREWLGDDDAPPAAGPGVRAMTMTIDDLDRDLERYRSAADTVSSNLLELDGDPNRQLLETAPLTGTTAGEWADARPALTSVWDWFARLTTFLDQATELRVSPRTRLAPGRERALADFLSQPSIELGSDAIPLRDRDLLQARRATSRCTADELLALMSDAFARAREVVSRVGAAWDELVPRLAQHAPR